MAPILQPRLILKQDITPQEFAERFERPRLPVVITGLTDGWGACKEWTPECLLQQFGSHKFKVRAGNDVAGGERQSGIHPA